MAAPKQFPDLPVPRVRHAHPDEIPDLNQLAWQSKATWGYDADFMAAAIPDLEVTADQVGAGHVFVIELRGELLAFCTIEIDAQNPGSAELVHCFVAPGHQGQNLGRLLWNYSLRELQQRYPAVRRLTVVSDPNAVGFYERCGARRVGYTPSIVDPRRLLPRLAIEVPKSFFRPPE